jgi:hypothetical protein
MATTIPPSVSPTEGAVVGWGPTLESLYGDDTKDVLLVYQMLRTTLQGAGFHDLPLAHYTTACVTLNTKPNKKLVAVLDGGASSGYHMLDLSTEYFGVRGFLAFIVTIPRLPKTITNINLQTLRLDSTLVVLLAHTLKEVGAANSIESLDLSHNTFGSLGAQALVEMAEHCANIIQLKVDGVEMVAPVHRKLAAVVSRNRVRYQESNADS